LAIPYLKFKSSKKRRSGEAHVPFLSAKAATTLVGILTLLVLAGILVTCYQRIALKGRFRETYEGRVVEKYVNYHESQHGTFVTKYILLKPADGEQFSVAVSSEIFDRAQVGMWIRRTKAGVELSNEGQTWK
jgi:hypothetical protein